MPSGPTEGELDHLVEALGFVNSADDFHEQPAVTGSAI
jgi:hypothetical protein